MSEIKLPYIVCRKTILHSRHSLVAKYMLQKGLCVLEKNEFYSCDISDEDAMYDFFSKVKNLKDLDLFIQFDVRHTVDGEVNFSELLYWRNEEQKAAYMAAYEDIRSSIN